MSLPLTQSFLTTFSFWSPSLTMATCALVGAIIAILYNYEFIAQQRRVGWTLAAASAVFPVLFTEAFMSYMAIDDFKVGNLVGLVTGLIAFGAVRFIMENQTGIVDRIVKSILRKHGEKNDGDS